MSERRRICKGERTVNRARPSDRTTTGGFRLIVVAVGIACGVLVLLAMHGAAGQPNPTAARRSPTLRRLQRAASVYKLDSPVQLEVHVVKVELLSTGNVAQQWRSISELLSSDNFREEGLTDVVDSLRGFGETAMLHSGVCLLTSNESTYVYSGRRIPVRRTGASGEGGAALPGVAYRELGQKLTVKLDGLDAEGRISFNYNIELNYVGGETRGATVGAPTFASFNTDARANVRDGETLTIQNFDRSTALLIFLTPRIVK